MNNGIKNIAITANTGWYIYNFRANTIKELIKNGYAVYVICPKDKYIDKLINLGCNHIHISLAQKSINPFLDIITFLHFVVIYYRYNFNIVLNFTPKNNIYSTCAASLFNTRIINNISGLGSVFSKTGLIKKIALFLYRYSLKKADVIFFQNKDDYLTLSQSIRFPPNILIDIIPGSGVDLTRFKAAPFEFNKKNLKFIMSSRLIVEKGVFQYYEAAKLIKRKYPSTVFLLAGFIEKKSISAVPIEIINDWVREGIINYLGSTDQIENFISQADCFVLPSYYSEGVPKSLLEAAALAKPIITTDNVGCREVIEHNDSGYVVDPKSVSSLFNAMEKFINLSDNERLDMANKVRARAENIFDEQIVINKYIEAINNL